MQHHIPTKVARYQLCRLIYCLLQRRLCFVNLGLCAFFNADNGACQVASRCSKLNAVIPVQQHIVSSFDNFGCCINPQAFKCYMYGIAQSHALQKRFAFVLHGLLKLRIAQFKAYFRYTDFVRLNVAQRGLFELFIRRPLCVILAEVQQQHARKAVLVFRHIYHRARAYLCNSTGAVSPIRIHAGIHISAVFFLGEVCQVFPVTDANSPVGAALTVEFYGVVVPLVFSAIYIQYAAVYTAQQAAQAAGHRRCKISSG